MFCKFKECQKKKKKKSFVMDVLSRLLLLFYVPNRSQLETGVRDLFCLRLFTGPARNCIFVVLPDLLPREPPLLGPVPASPTLTQFASTDTDEID